MRISSRKDPIMDLEIERQWFHSIFTLLNGNRPTLSDGGSMVADEMQNAAWKQYCRLNKAILNLEKSIDLNSSSD